MAPLFSIITVTYNAEKTLPPTLKSVAEQTCDLYEWIVVDGGSKDATMDLVKESGVSNLKYISERDNGIYDAMNKGLAMATGDYVIFLNAGDSFHSPATLQRLADVAMDHDYPGILYGQTQIVDEKRQPLGMRHLQAPRDLTLDSFKEGMVVCHQAFVPLRRLTNQYDTRYRLSADYDWCIGCLQRSRRNQYIDDILVDYLSEGMTTANMKASLRERFKIMCVNYGTIPTIIRHFGFLKRYLSRRGAPTA